jgi:predicted GH43/DUF377 family glycosyl hydrolase
MITMWVVAGWVLEPVAGTITENGIGRPSVAYVAETDEYVMIFETRLPASFYDPGAYPGCPDGVWALGRATSSDGVQWSVDPDPVLMPVPGTFASCVVAHPDLVFDEETWHLWFKTEQSTEACAVSAPAWGCERYTGIGYAASLDGVRFTARPEPILPVEDFGPDLLALGYPSTVIVEGDFTMLVSKQYTDSTVRMFLATSTDLGQSWQLERDAVFSPGASDWIRDRIYNPSLVCEDDPELLRYTVFFGGRDDARTTSGFGRAASADGLDWYVDAESPWLTWDTSAVTPWSNWFVMRAGEDYVAWFAERDEAGRNRLGLATTAEGWDEAAISPRVCPPPEPEPTIDTGPSDGVLRGECGCAAGDARAVLLLPFVLGLFRRRPRAR